MTVTSLTNADPVPSPKMSVLPFVLRVRPQGPLHLNNQPCQANLRFIEGRQAQRGACIFSCSHVESKALGLTP